MNSILTIAYLIFDSVLVFFKLFINITVFFINFIISSIKFTIETIKNTIALIRFTIFAFFFFKDVYYHIYLFLIEFFFFL